MSLFDFTLWQYLSQNKFCIILGLNGLQVEYVDDEKMENNNGTKRKYHTKQMSGIQL